MASFSPHAPIIPCRGDTLYSFEVAVAPPMLNSATPILIYEREARSRQWANARHGPASGHGQPRRGEQSVLAGCSSRSPRHTASQRGRWFAEAVGRRPPGTRRRGHRRTVSCTSRVSPEEADHRLVIPHSPPLEGGPSRELGYTSNCVRQMLAGPRTRHRGGTLPVNNSWMAM